MGESSEMTNVNLPGVAIEIAVNNLSSSSNDQPVFLNDSTFWGDPKSKFAFNVC